MNNVPLIKVVVYAGPHYGQVHTLLHGDATTWTLRHDATGDVVTALKWDCEVVL